MKLMIRNLLYLFKRFKTAVVLNLFGLTIAFAAFLLIVMQVDYEMNYDAMHSKSGRTFRLEANHGEFEHNAIHCLMFSDAFVNSSAHITDYSYRYPFYGGERYCQIDEVDDQGEAKVFKENFQLCLPNISDIFDFHMKEGSVECLSIPGSVLIPESVAKRLFDKQSAIGKRIRMSGSSGWQPVSTTILTIGGVYKDFPGNTTVQNRIYVPMDQLDLLKSSWQMYANEIYVTLDDPLNKEEVLDHFNKTFDFAKSQMGSAQEIALRLTPLKDVYYTHDTTFDFNPKGHRETNYVLLGIAFLILFIAGINFTNLTTSLIPLRLKTINTHRVLGCSIYKLRAISLIESIVICLISYILALFIVNDLSYTPIANWVDADIRLSQYKGLILLTALIAILTGCLAGLYPAIRSTSYAPALVLKGSFGLSPKGKKVRVALIGFQYTVSIALIIVTLFMGLQNHFMTSSEQLGFNKDQVAIVNLTPEIYAKHKPQYIQKLKDYPGIEDVAFSVYELSKEDDMIDLEYARHEDKDVFFKVFYASENFLFVMDIQVEEGRDFTREDLNKAQSDYIINPAAERDFHLHPGDRFNDRTVLGVSKDFRFNSCRIASSPFVFALNNDIPNPKLVSYIRFNSKTNLQEAVAHVRETLKEIDPTFPFEISFYNTILNNLYQKEQTLGKLISLFGIMAILISIVGVFGLVLFETQYRRKEIGIRKINGATTGQILLMFNKTYIRIVSVCFIISIPIAWMGTQQWLENFAYKTPLHLWVFIVAFLIILSVTIGTVTFRNWQAANENPVNSVKSE
ncbi:ABC transporter permease [Parabacteroides distasonis]|uniref:ABC transporter permease n=1 Tax=Parabacteroides distasonis TaxID=823 RepID=UPI0018A01A3C|nr:ABC transporter permease [Parabacteroides distasonis]MDB9150538.1 ABC transporter permease [Parabacteroides distasonis]MDB9155079.1 ABC transporter permease [Parabacteroides distasonis]MDB9164090.1 ABC transporter permease [Parabacteroides distasonis]MDB9168827.1 ABC transporter permease [Parabacteroides distasonis]MDB9195677.1 ABC transporter permease [Parabacteroides distasonis]